LKEFGSLADVLSHEMQNPLQTVRGQLELAIETEDVTHVEETLFSVDRMDRLIDDIADTLESGAIVGEREEIDVTELVGSIWDSVDRQGEVVTRD
jgi:signal transduction histidine kinase